MKYQDMNTGDSQGSKTPTTQTQAMDIEGDPALEFNAEFLECWKSTANYALFNRLTSDAMLFSIVEPRHPCAGGLNIEDVQRRLAQQVAELHLDERVREGREVLNKSLASGQKKVSAAFSSFWADIESMRENQRRKNEEKAQQQVLEARASMDIESVSSPASPRVSVSSTRSSVPSSWSIAPKKSSTVDLSQQQTQSTVSSAGQRASAYLSSWSTWASERRKEWQDRKASSSSTATSPSPPSSTPKQSPMNVATTVLSRADSRRGRSSRHSDNGDVSPLSRSSSRRKRLSSLLRRNSSRESGLDGGSVAESKASEEHESKTNEPTLTVTGDSEPLSSPTAKTTNSSPSLPGVSEVDGDAVEDEQSAPTPTILPSDNLQVSTPTTEPAISPLRLDVTQDNIFDADEEMAASSTNPNPNPLGGDHDEEQLATAAAAGNEKASTTATKEPEVKSHIPLSTSASESESLRDSTKTDTQTKEHT